MNASTRFIVIDDDELNNKICTAALKKASDVADIKTFLNPVEGFDYISSEYAQPGHNSNAVLFLDLNMPVMNGWEFLDRFDKLAETIKKKVQIYILSSSVDKRDMDMASRNKNVMHYLVKPLTKEAIRRITHA